MPRFRLPILPIALLLLALLPLFRTTARAVAADLIIGAGPDSHRQLVCQLAALLLEKEGYTVVIKGGTIDTELHRLLQRGEINLCFQRLAVGAAPEQPADIVRLPPLPFATGPVLLMRSKQAARLDVESISQLVELSRYDPLQFRFADIDLAGAKQLAGYGLSLSSTRPLPSALLYNALKNNQVDVALGRADDGRIIAFRLLALTDDRKALPDLRATPLTSKTALKQFPAIPKALAVLGKHLDSETMRRLHGNVIIAHRQPRTVAEEWLQGQHLL